MSAITVAISTDRLDLYQASEVRESSGRRRYGAVDTLRRKIKRGILPAALVGGRYLMERSDLEALVQAVARTRATEFDELEAAAKRVAAAAPRLNTDQRARLATLLGGASA